MYENKPRRTKFRRLVNRAHHITWMLTFEYDISNESIKNVKQCVKCDEVQAFLEDRLLHEQSRHYNIIVTD